MTRPAGLALAAALVLTAAPLAQAQPLDKFDRADANHDGRVTLQEYESFVGGHLMKSNGRMAQRVKSLDPEQQATVLERRFERLDKAHKGYLEPADWQKRRS